MGHTTFRVRKVAVLATAAPIAASCSSGSDSTSSSDQPAASDGTAPQLDDTTVPGAGSDSSPDTGPPASDVPDSAPGSTPDGDGPAPLDDFASLDPPTGDPIVIGMVNTEGAPGPDFPELRTGGEVTGPAIFETLETSTDILGFPNDNPMQCGIAADYPSVCSFVFPAGEYVSGGELATVPGFEACSVVDYLP